MNKLSNHSLVVFVQLVQQELSRLAAERERMDADDPRLPDLEEELLDCSQVADELKVVYQSAAESSGNLPTYQQLMHSQVPPGSRHRLRA